MQRETFEELCSGYVLGALSTEEALEFERELAVADSESQRFFEGVAFAALHLPLGVEMVAPPPHVKVKILQAILPEPEPEPTLWQRIVSGLGLDRPSLAWSAAFLFLFGVLGASVYSFKLNDNLGATQAQNATLTQTITRKDQRITALTGETRQLKHELKKTRRALTIARGTIARQKELIEVMRGKQVRLVTLGAKKADSFGKVIWDPMAQKAVLQLAGLPKPKNKDYQLWWIVKKGRKLKINPAGVYSIPAAGPRTFFEIPKKYIPKVRRRRRTNGIFGITIEKVGGVQKPSMAPIIAGKIKIRL